jgi:pimeloyl-ACP methyl ester carboxylesterase
MQTSLFRILFAALSLCVLAAFGPVVRRGTVTGATTRPVARSGQYGAERLDFRVQGHDAFLIRPPRARADGSRPWAWYAPTFASRLPNDRHEWIMTRLLGEGIAIAGVDVGESYGSPSGREAFDAFYRAVTTEFGLAAKACLLPQSRGGLMLYNWAVEHPERVLCIGGIYPVCDLTSYPGLTRAAPAYGMTADQLRASLDRHNPVERLKPLAEIKVPILHLHGDEDKIVPLDLNSGELVRRYTALGGAADLHVVRGKGHEEVDEFFRSRRLVDFFVNEVRRVDRRAGTRETPKG